MKTDIFAIKLHCHPFMLPGMELHIIALFTATILPLVCTPGPDMLFVASQALSGGRAAGLRSTLGVCLGYSIHSALAAYGIAAIVAASPLLFESLRWAGIAYLVYLAGRLIQSAFAGQAFSPVSGTSSHPIRRGFLTALLNPKGMMIYLAILPQFMRTDENAALQAVILSCIFVFSCGVIYSLLSIAIGRTGKKHGVGNLGRRRLEASAGGLLFIAAIVMAAR